MIWSLNNCIFTFQLYDTVRRHSLMTFIEVLVYDSRLHPKSCVYLVKLRNYDDLLMGMLSAQNPDTISQSQNRYPLFLVYIIPPQIRARCWHKKLHLSTLLWHFIVSSPKKFQKTFTLSEASTQGMSGILLM